MPSIHALPPEEIEKIAAGEVVERPVSVVKELIENSLDAQATEIIIEIEEGGKSYIRVSDNGSGIPYDELELAVKNFHTSKINSCEDIYHQTTLGFRGEALAAISAVSRLTLSSRHIDEEIGGQLIIEGGKVLSLKRFAQNTGTCVEVRDLFFNTPVRKKFLRSKATETFHVVNLLKNYVLAFGKVAFCLKSANRILLQSDGKGLGREVLTQVFGADIAENLSLFEKEYPPLGISGLIGPPSLYSEERKLQFFFVNNRPVKSRLLFRAVDDAVREYVSPNRFPPLVLWLLIPPEEVDVNIHPTKSEVAFMHQQQVYSAIVVALKDAMAELSTSRKAMVLGEPESFSLKEQEDIAIPSSTSIPSQTSAAEGVRLIPIYEMDEPVVPGKTAEAFERLVPISFPEEKSRPEEPPYSRQVTETEMEEAIISLASELRIPSFVQPDTHSFACQLFNTFLLSVSKEEVIVVDQHSAHERLIFERLWSAFCEGRSFVQDRQALLFPVEVKVDESTLELFKERSSVYTALGFRARLSGSEILIEEIPSIFLAHEADSRMPAILLELLTFDRSRMWDEKVKERLSTLACKSAIKSGDVLKPLEIKLIMSELRKISDWSSCPHGRPTILKFRRSDFERLFRRQ